MYLAKFEQNQALNLQDLFSSVKRKREKNVTSELTSDRSLAFVTSCSRKLMLVSVTSSLLV